MFLEKMVEEDLLDVENSVKSEENGLGWYVKNNIESLLIAVKTRRIITCHESVDLKEFKTIEEPRKHEQTEKRMHEEFARNKMTRITTHEDG